MRIAKVSAEVVEQMVLESLRRRADPVTRRVYPSWKLMMREIGVCRQRIADARAEERQKAEEKAEKARDEERADAISVLQDMGMTPEKIAEFKAKLEALKK